MRIFSVLLAFVIFFKSTLSVWAIEIDELESTGTRNKVELASNLEIPSDRGSPVIAAPDQVAVPQRGACEILNSFAAQIKDGFKANGQYAYAATVMWVLPIVSSDIIPTSWLNTYFWIGAGSIIVTNFFILEEAIGAISSWKTSARLHESAPVTDLPKNLSAIVSAYLPNETNVLKDSLSAILKIRLPEGTHLRVIVAHNGGTSDQIEKLRREIAELPPSEHIEITELNVEGSRSKAENVNEAIHVFSNSELPPPDICALYDADHQPDSNAYIYALQTMKARDADLLQGRCAIMRGGSDFWTSVVAPEFDIIYGLNHAGGDVIRGFAFFGGTNGFWKFDLLKKIGMDSSMLTEDIDSSLRALKSGANVVFDPLVLSNEEAPDSFQALMKQRLRWAQGWTQVTVKHSVDLITGRHGDTEMFRDNHLTPYQKAMVFLLLDWREIYNYVAPIALPAAVFYYVRTGDSGTSVPMLVASVVQIVMPMALTALSANLVKDQVNSDMTPAKYARFAILSPFYDMVKTSFAIMGHFRNIVGLTKWVVTSRGMNQEKPSSIVPVNYPEI
jgi:cellulose synthase/poly-beta-1,6-N-acetylglucosamine synthase-like glycosyltransferase